MLMHEATMSFDDTVGWSEGKLLSGWSGSPMYLMVGPTDFGPLGYAMSESLNAVISLTKSRLGTKTG